MRAKKQFGQHFLNSQKILGDIISAATISKDDTVLEIGPGKGVLTEALLEHAGSVVAIEKDRELVELLKEKFADHIASGNLVLLEEDALLYALEQLGTKSYKVVANIPYYITGALIRKFLESNIQPISMTLLVQKEVAHRIVARDGKESILSLSVKAYGTPKYVERVPARYFSPAPKVDSAILHIKDISKKSFSDISEEHFFNVVKTGFAHKRKVLQNNLEVSFDKNDIEKACEICSIEKSARPEDLTLLSWLCLAANI